MRHRIQARPDATEEHLTTIGRLREAIDHPAKLSLLIDLRASFKSHRDWQSEERYLIDRHQSPMLPSLLESLETSGVSLREAVSAPLLFAMNAR